MAEVDRAILLIEVQEEAPSDGVQLDLQQMK